MKPKNERHYIGDGLFATYDGFAFWLIAPRDGVDHYVVLEPEVLSAFLGFVENRMRVKITITKATDE